MNKASDSEFDENDENARKWSALVEGFNDIAESSAPNMRKIRAKRSVMFISVAAALLIASVLVFHATKMYSELSAERMPAVSAHQTDSSAGTCCRSTSAPSGECCGE